MNIVETIIIIGIASIIGFVSDKVKPTEYYYEDRIVTVYKKYQCPKYCNVEHHHSVYFEGDGMIIDKNQLGKKYKKKKSRKKK